MPDSSHSDGEEIIIIDPPIGPGSSAEELREWIAELKVLPYKDRDEVQIEIERADKYLRLRKESFGE